ncbi:hypothetical protein [Streptomyces sp. NPDC018031]|uniref:hypothetical protein n=1 Tax=Streptomyces sp. NPDC018031 TaxID=3365033 RepID=UPI00379A211A
MSAEQGDASVERGRAASLATAVARGARTSGWGARTRLTTVVERIVAQAPRVPVRDLATLRAQFPGLGPEQLADRLVAGAMRGTSTVGAGVGAVAMLPVPPAVSAELAAEIVGVAWVEFKLVAELHEVYGLRAPGALHQRTAAYLGSWSQERGVDVHAPVTVDAALGGELRRQLRQRVLKRSFRSLPGLTPFLMGAVVGAATNRRETARLAARIRADLRSRQVPWGTPPSTAVPAAAG